MNDDKKLNEFVEVQVEEDDELKNFESELQGISSQNNGNDLIY